MNKSFLAIIASFLVPAVHAGAPIESGVPTLGTVSCEPDSGGPCRLAWDVSGNRGAFHWIEEMDPESTTWRRVLGPVQAPFGITGQPVEGGRLYRVVACADPSGKESCRRSTVYWAVFHPMSKDAIPDAVDDRHGAPMQVSKRLSLRAQKQQYNLYLLVRLMNGTDMGSMPPMTPPRFGLDTPKDTVINKGSEDDIIQHRAYRLYEERRISLSKK